MIDLQSCAVEVEVLETRGGIAAGEHRRLALVLDDERVAVERDERRREQPEPTPCNCTSWSSGELWEIADGFQVSRVSGGVAVVAFG